jgi:hypothetical protein
LIRKRKEIIRRTKPRDAEPDTRHYEGERGSFVSLTVPSLNHWRPHFTGAIVFLFVPFFPWLSTCIACVIPIHIKKSILVQVIIQFHSKNCHCNQNKIVKEFNNGDYVYTIYQPLAHYILYPCLLMSRVDWHISTQIVSHLIEIYRYFLSTSLLIISNALWLSF